MEKKETTYDHVIKYTGLFGGVQGLTMLVTIVRTKLTALFLGATGVGMISRMTNLIELVHHTTDFGICFSAIKHVSEIFEEGDEGKINDFIKTVRTVALMLGLLGLMVMVTVAWFIPWTSAMNILTLAPIAPMMIVASGEGAILKGTKQLKKVAVISVFSAIAILAVTAPIYYKLGFPAIALALLLSNAANMIITLYFSTKRYPYNISLLKPNAQFLVAKPMLALGLGYVIAGFFGTGAEYVIREVIQRHSGMEAVGLYTCGYSIVVSYASYVFTAMQVDFFPRLAGCCHDQKRMNETINQQIEVYAMLMAPLLTVFVLFMPHIVHLLYSVQFSMAIPMSVCAVVFMYFKAFFGPVEYLALAKGDSKMYMFVELAYDVVLAMAIPFSYIHFGLAGCGVALSMLGALNMVFVLTLYSKRYGFRLSTRLLTFYVMQFMLLLYVIMAVMHDVTNAQAGFRWIKWTVGPVCSAISIAISYRILSKETTIIEKIKRRLEVRG